MSKKDDSPCYKKITSYEVWKKPLTAILPKQGCYSSAR